MKTKSHYDSPLGGITLITDETALLGLWFDWQPGYADDDSAVLGDSPTIGADDPMAGHDKRDRIAVHRSPDGACGYPTPVRTFQLQSTCESAV